jgi:hypothetical protein
VNAVRVVLARSKVVVFVVLVLAAFGVRVSDCTAPRRVRLAVTRPLAAALGTLPSATRLRSTSTQDSAEILVDFDAATDARADLHV